MTESSNTTSSHLAPADDEIDLARLFGLLLDHIWLIIAITFMFALGGVAYALLVTPVYQGDALVQVERRSSVSPLGGLSEVMGESGDSSTAAEVQILQSRMVLGKVVDRVGLDTVVQPRLLPFVGEFLRRQGIERPDFMEGRPWVWAGERLEVGRLEVAGYLRGTSLTLRSLGGERFQVLLQNREGVQPLGEGVVGQLISFRNGDITLRIAELRAAPGAEFTLLKRSRPAAIANIKSRLSVSEVGGGRGSSTGMLSLTLSGTEREEIRRSLNTVAETFLTQNVERQSAQAQQSLEFLREQAPELRTQLSQAENALNEYRVAMDSVDLSSESQAAIEQFIALEQQLNELEFQEAELAQRFTPNHPAYQTLLRKKRQLQQERAQLNERVNELPAAQQEVVRLTRDMEVTQAIYVNVLNKAQELEVARAGTVGNVRIIDDGLVGGAPIEPRKSLIVVVATLLGAMLSTGFVLMRGLLRRGVESPEQIEEAGLPVYATVPLSEEQGKLVHRVKHRRDKKTSSISSGLLAERAPADNAVEALRGLRTSLHFAMMEAGNNRLMMTGPSPAIGKSFIAINLGAVCAQAGQRVLVVDADLRKGQVHHAFDERAEGGLSDLLSGQAESGDLIRKTQIEGLDYVSRGQAPPNPSELLMNIRFSEFLEEMGAIYDLMIMDTPPILAVTDAAIVGKQCDTSLMVARFQQNSVKEIQIASRRLQSTGVNLKGIILNAMEQRGSTYYGYGYYAYTYK